MKNIKRVIKYIAVSLAIIILVIVFKIQSDEIGKLRDYESKFEGSLIYLKEYRALADSMLKVKDDSIVFLLNQIDSLERTN